MTSKEVAKCDAAENRRRSPLDHLPPPANSNKPLTPFSIEDILNKPSVKRNYTICGTAHLISSSEKHRPSGGVPLSGRALLTQTSPLCALEELASKTFKGLEVSVLQAAEACCIIGRHGCRCRTYSPDRHHCIAPWHGGGLQCVCVSPSGRDGMTLFGQRNTPKKRRKSRTAFTNHQIYELEKRFLYQKYLSPADRDQIAQQLGLTNAQVITWFQNRRAKLKRDLEEMKADVESAKAVGQVPLEKLAKLADLEKCANGTLGHPRAGSPTQGPRQDQGLHKLRMSPMSPFSDHTTSKECSEDEDVEIDVDD
ncbi:Transcription factor LBX1 [Merluccius polli]|uniref:Transcription factor LBX1 n=1 Tax=Merluccius polli TaxID=89951 RepID=A0AA47N319_MERPO|nr:Transcription factor LBX1 [Merluccius polli]